MLTDLKIISKQKADSAVDL